MSHKSILVFFLFILCQASSFSQEHQTVLNEPEGWLTEIIPFPLGFAQDIDFTGFEDLRFAPQWSDSTSQNFWTYSFVWYIDKQSHMTEDILTDSFNKYYDGLMGVDHHNKQDSTGTNQLDKTICLFIKTDAGFSGKMRVWDRFFTRDYITLNIKVRESFCEDTQKQAVFCDITPQPFEHEVWKLFDQVQLIVDCE